MRLQKMANQSQKIVYKLVLTGGPCGGKTTGQSRLSTFFENLGWKVFRVPETATVLLSGGVKFADLTPDEAFKFQENLLKTMIQIENTFFELGRTCQKNCLIICDRGAMDASAFISKDKWEAMLAANNMHNVELRDNRYNHIVHMVSAANGAEDFYSTEDHACRSEGVELARELDYNAAAAWIGHPYFDVIDNSTDFDKKMNRLIACVCQKIGIDTGDRLNVNSKKRKFLVKTPLCPDSEFPPFQDFDVVHNYLQSDVRKAQVRLRKRGQKNHWSYIHTLRKFHPTNGQSVEVRTQLTHRDYLNLLPQRDDAHFTIFKKRRCFIYNNQYYQLDIYRQPTHPRCRGLVLLETYSAAYDQDTLLESLPKFLTIEKEVTGDPAYSMYNLSLKEDWKTSKRYYAGTECNGHKCRNNHSDEKNGHPDKINDHTDKMNGHVDKMNGHADQMNGDADKMNGDAHKKNSHTDEMHNHADKMNGDVEKINSHTDKMTGHTDKMNGDAHKKNSHTDKMNGHTGKMNGDAEKMNSHADKMNGHTDKMNSHADKMNSHADKMNSHTDKMNGHTGKINSHADKMNSHADKINSHGKKGHEMNGHCDKNGHVDKKDGCSHKINGHHHMNGHAKTDDMKMNIKDHRMDLGSPKIQKVA